MEVINKFKGLDLIDRVPEELWMVVHDIVQEAVTRPWAVPAGPQTLHLLEALVCPLTRPICVLKKIVFPVGWKV